jgi:replicative DNA helicase
MPPSEIIDRIHVQLDGRPAPDMTSLKVVRAGDDMSPAWFENIVRAHGDWPQVVIVDHLGLLVSEDAQDPIEERKDINSVLRFVRQTKAQSQITYLFLHHITRAGATADKLDLSHLAGSGRIERDADCVLLMTRQTIEVAKARYGRMGIVKATCDTRGMWRENI